MEKKATFSNDPREDDEGRRGGGGVGWASAKSRIESVVSAIHSPCRSNQEVTFLAEVKKIEMHASKMETKEHLGINQTTRCNA